ncbi:unnamed protein product [Trypanosoma congolense IL3000]|uniref:WGS project CAEQ00000000 data, annotated contig 867 n=1 Tax=Trypanosoma congolense (strain IL3000) TaxID=1068625 RepID=F9WJ37_TRYCI|nr:unnamed protein product [Trypanosoma congolense IL3000]
MSSVPGDSWLIFLGKRVMGNGGPPGTLARSLRQIGGSLEHRLSCTGLRGPLQHSIPNAPRFCATVAPLLFLRSCSGFKHTQNTLNPRRHEPVYLGHLFGFTQSLSLVDDGAFRHLPQSFPRTSNGVKITAQGRGKKCHSVLQKKKKSDRHWLLGLSLSRH